MRDDFLFAWRRLQHSPGFTVLAVTTFALAIGANTAIFSIADAVLFRPMPYAQPDDVFVLQMRNRQTGALFTSMNIQTLQAFEEHHTGLGAVGLLESRPSLLVSGEGGVEAVLQASVSPSYFEILRVTPAHGRLFQSSDSTTEGRLAVLSYASWRDRFGARRDIVGSSVPIGALTFDVIGVLPPGFVFPSAFAGKAEVVTLSAPLRQRKEGPVLNPVVRLEPGITVEQGQAELEAIATSVEKRSDAVAPALTDVRSILYPAGRPIMQLLLASAMLVLLIGCANLANLLVVRGHRQERETAVRAALGAGMLRLVRPLVFEGVLVAMAGAVAAILATRLGFASLLRHVPPIAYREAPVGVDIRVTLMMTAFALAGAITFTVLPAIRVMRLRVPDTLKGNQSTIRRRLGTPLVALQVGIAIVLVFGTVVASRAFLEVLRVPLGFEAHHVITIDLAPPREAKGIQRQAFYVRLLETLAAHREVVSVGAAGALPLDNRAPYSGAFVSDERRSPAGVVHVLPGFFETARMRLLRGRLPRFEDVSDRANVAVVSDSAARALFGNRDPLGATFSASENREFTVIGIVSDVVKSLDRETQPLVYVIGGEQTSPLRVVVRTRARSELLLTDIKRAAAALVPATPITAVWWDDAISGVTAYRNPRFQSLVLGTFALLALGLTALGVSGVVSFFVAVRRREMGIRLAIGASPRSLVRMVVREAMLPVAAGIIVGLLATRWLARLAEAQLFKVDTRDPTTLAIAVATVVITAVIASYVPARQSSRIDPVAIIRAE
jgi:predicted permease